MISETTWGFTGVHQKNVVPEPTPWDLIPMAGNLGVFGKLKNPPEHHTPSELARRSSETLWPTPIGQATPIKF